MSRRFGLSLILIGLLFILLRSAPQSLAQPATFAAVPTFTPTPPSSILATPVTPPRIASQQRRNVSLPDRRPFWWLVFDRPMDQPSVQAALQIQPALSANLRWVNQTLYLEPESALTPETHYTFTVRNTATDRNGIPLGADYTWHYDLPATVRTVTGPNEWDRIAPLAVTFNYAMDLASVTAALTLTPTVVGEWRWNTEQTVISLHPAEPLASSATYTLGFASDLYDAQGDPLPAPLAAQYTAPSAITNKSPQEDTYVDPKQPIILYFDRAMDQSSTTAAFTITPPISGTVTWWNGTTLSFAPTRGYLEENTLYSVNLAPMALDSSGRSILRLPYTWSFNTTELSRPAHFSQDGANIQLLDAAGRRAIHYQFSGQASSANTETTALEFALYRLDQAQFLEHFMQTLPERNNWRKRAIPYAGLEEAKRWSVAVNLLVDQNARMSEVQIPADVAPGLYVLTVGDSPFDEQLFVVLTRHVLMLKTAPDQLAAWLTEINGANVAAAQVSFYDQNGRLIGQGSTDETGIFQSALAQESQPALVIASVDDDLTVAGLDSQWQSRNGQWWGWWQADSAAHASAAYIYTDRPIYRPDQQVNFKAMLRSDDDASLSLLPLNTPVTVTLRDARNNAVQRLTLVTNDFGTLHGDFHLADGAMLGDYAIELLVSGERHRQIFKVEEYRKPDYAVTVLPSARQFIAGETISVRVASRYFYDAPTPNASVTVKQYQLQPRDWGLGAEPQGQYAWYDLGTSERRGQTDANGYFTFTLPATLSDNNFGGDWQSSLHRAHWGIEVTVDDGSHQTVSGFAVVTVLSANEKIWIEPGNYAQQTGTPFILEARVATINQETVADRHLTAQVQRVGWSAGNTTYTSVQTITAQTDTQGQAAIPLTITAPGYYEVKLQGEDSQGKPMGFSRWLFVSDQANSWSYFSSADRLHIRADRQSYAAGDNARLLIETQIRGPALLTFERGRTRRSQLVELTPPLTTVDVTIQEEDAPNIFVTVNSWEAQDTHIGQQDWVSKADSRLFTASVNLHVPPQHKRLTVNITPDQSHYGPRTSATFTVTVRNGAGQPVTAELALALVDEAIFSLSEELAGPIFDAFYRERPNLVKTYDGLAPIRWFSGMGGGGEGGASANPRSNFPDTALWLPVVRTDGAGQAVVTVTLPDNLTTWRLTAKAITAQQTQVGEAAMTVVTQQPLIVRPLLPRLLTAGDQAELSALVQNESDQQRTITVTLQLSPTGLLALQGHVTQTLELAPHATGIVGWPVRARQAGTPAITVVATSGDGLADAARLLLPIRALAVPDSQSWVGEFRGDFSIPITLPGVSLDSSSVTVEVNRSLAGSLFNGLEYLTGYPYGCVEQTMSRALPNAVVGRALHQLGLPSPALHAELPALVDAGLQRLYGFQHSDGGWGWWHDDATDAYQTAWVLFGLSVTQQAGYPVEPAVIKRGVEWLRPNLTTMDLRTRAYALYSLAVAGYGELPLTRDLLAQVDQLDAFSQAALALTLHSLGLEAEAETLADRLATGALVRDGQAYWPNAQSDGYYHHKTMASTTRTTALVLSALTRIRPGNERIGESVRWLMNQRQGAGWGTTNETAYAILGLTDHLLALPATNAATRYRVELNGVTLRNGVLDRQQTRAQVTIPAAQLQPGVNQLRLVAEDDGRLYYAITQRTELAQAQIATAGKVGVTRSYLDAASGQPLAQATPGQLVQVRLRVTVPEAAFYVLVEDKLPGGLEALNERLNTTSHVASAYGQEPAFYWQEYGYNYKELRDGRVSFFITELPAGEREFTYLARVTHVGDFTALPAEAYAMYDAAMWGRSASNRLTVRPEPVAYKPVLAQSVIWYMTNQSDDNVAITAEWRTKTLPYTPQLEQPALTGVYTYIIGYLTSEGLYPTSFREQFSPKWRYALVSKPVSDLGERQPHWVLHLVELSTGLTRPLVDNANGYVWSPDEQQIAYIFDHTIYTLRLDADARPVALFTHSEAGGFLSWSPDGRWLVTTTTHEGIPDPGNNYPYTQTVWLISTQDQAAQQLASSPALGMEHVSQEMAWSADSQYLVFQGEILGLDGSRVKLEDADVVNLWVPNQRQLLVAGSNGLRIVNVLGNPQMQVSDQSPHFLEQAFSHDGTRLAYTKHHYAQEQTDLWVFDFVAGQNQQITTLPTGCMTKVRWSTLDDALIVGCLGASSIWAVLAQLGQTPSVMVERGFLLEVVPLP